MTAMASRPAVSGSAALVSSPVFAPVVVVVPAVPVVRAALPPPEVFPPEVESVV